MHQPSEDNQDEDRITPEEAVELLHLTSEQLIKSFLLYGLECAIIVVNPEEGDASYHGVKSEWMTHAVESTAKQLKDEQEEDSIDKTLH